MQGHNSDRLRTVPDVPQRDLSTLVVLGERGHSV